MTIDGEDARDFDDAVWAEPDPDPANPGGWHVVVAIADVAAYVAPGSALDGEAALRGNSVYFPDRVVPMLPEALSNDLCSLRPDEDRPCIAALLWIDSQGRKRRHRFERAIMRSAARLTYEAVQAAHDGSWRYAADPVRAPRRAIWRVCRSRPGPAGARRAGTGFGRAPVVLDEDRRPVAVVPRTRLDSQRLIEEFMILANVAAAEELEARQLACMYRVHDSPDPEKLAALRDFLDEIGIPGLALAKGQVVRPELFNRILRAPPRRRSAKSSTSWSCAARHRPCTVRTISAISGWRCRATRISRRRSGVMPISLCIGRWSAAAPRRARRARKYRRDRRAHLGDRAPRGGGRTQRARALPRDIVGRRDRHRIRGADKRRGVVRVVRDPARDRRRRADPDIDAAVRLLRSRFGAAPSRRPPHGLIFALGDAVNAMLVEADAIGGRMVFRLEDRSSSRAAAPSRPNRGRPAGGCIGVGADGQSSFTKAWHYPR